MISSDKIDLLVYPSAWDSMDDVMVSIVPIEFDWEDEPCKNIIDSHQSRQERINGGYSNRYRPYKRDPIAVRVMNF